MSPDAVSIQATGLDPNYVTGGVDYGPVRRPFPVSKALDDAVLAWGMNGAAAASRPRLPAALVLPGWVGIGSIKWLGSLEVARTQLTSPWNTKWYVMTGGDVPARLAAAVRQPGPVGLGAAAPGATVPRGEVGHADRPRLERAAPIRRVDVSLDGGTTWRQAELRDGPGGTGGTVSTIGRRDTTTGTTTRRSGASAGVGSRSRGGSRPAGSYELLARATDAAGRQQPLTTPFNDNGYFFDAVVRHPVTVAVSNRRSSALLGASEPR